MEEEKCLICLEMILLEEDIVFGPCCLKEKKIHTACFVAYKLTCNNEDICMICCRNKKQVFVEREEIIQYNDQSIWDDDDDEEDNLAEPQSESEEDNTDNEDNEDNEDN